MRDFLSRSYGGSCLNKKNRGRRNAISIYIPVANSFTPERDQIPLPRCQFPDQPRPCSFWNFALVGRVESESDRPSSSKIINKKIMKDLRRQLQTPAVYHPSFITPINFATVPGPHSERIYVGEVPWRWGGGIGGESAIQEG